MKQFRKIFVIQVVKKGVSILLILLLLQAMIHIFGSELRVYADIT
jgi:hypothetical protein